jgi:aryl-alcohol dehydrogenase-like predicted oxidoreductase
MKLRMLGRTGWQVSAIACGTYKTFDRAGPAGQKQVAALMQANLDQGVTLFDSAPMYGLSEANIGHALASGRLKSASPAAPPLIATKVLQHDADGARRQIAESFKVLGIDAIGGRIDLLQIHNMAGWRAVLPLLAELKAQGRIRATGVTHYDPGAFGEIEQAMRTGQADVIQIPWNLMERSVERRLIPLARDLNLGVLVMTPICPLFSRSGLLAKLKGVDLSPWKDLGVTDAGSLCLKYLLSKHTDAVLLPATSRLERVASNAAVSGTPPLSPEDVRRLEGLFA